MKNNSTVKKKYKFLGNETRSNIVSVQLSKKNRNRFVVATCLVWVMPTASKTRKGSLITEIESIKCFFDILIYESKTTESSFNVS